MAFVYFSDADNGIHQVPSELTHFQPNEPGAPYVVAKLSVTYASGSVIEYRITADYFRTMLAFVDELSPAYDTSNVVKGLQIGAFVRYIGSKKAIPAIMNYMLANGSMDAIVMRALQVPEDGEPDLVIEYDDDCKRFAVFYNGSEDADCHHTTTPHGFVSAFLRIIDECEHVREIIDYIKTSTNASYARRLDHYDDRVYIIFDRLNPMRHLLALQRLANDFKRVPTHIVDDWVADMDVGH